ncbi:MAG: twin-arginine translocase subunit TatC [Gammaproteobacteria bacterium]|nr:twin-arginine translocase subunit TatC [Gammaproteobacteria bacterium]
MPQQQPLISHLMELRNGLLKSVLSIFVIFICLVAFANDIYHYISKPLLEQLPDGATMIATGVTSSFFAPFKLTLMLSFFIAIPVVLHQIWSFIAPALYKHEKRLVAPFLLSSTLLFYAGIAFAYYVVFPVVFGFFTSVAPEGVTIATDIQSYLDFILKLFFAFGLAFEIPIAIVLICWAGLTTPAQLRKKRPYIVVAAFVVGMLLTPPDIISQSMLAIPMLLLFECGLIVASLRKPKLDAEDDETSTTHD